jgi:tryptophan-rich sensory protein
MRRQSGSLRAPCWPLNRLAAALFVPYALWVGYAAALNLAIWRLEPAAPAG